MQPSAASIAGKDPLQRYLYAWPREAFSAPPWEKSAGRFVRTLPETIDDLARDSRWPGFFPSSLALVTTGSPGEAALEKVVGASIVNRFPYIIALSFCREDLSSRHYARSSFMRLLEGSGSAAVQFLPPGEQLDHVMDVIERVPDSETGRRIETTELPIRPGRVVRAPVFESSYMVYEARLVRPGKDFEGAPIHENPWIDIGSHRIYFLEIQAIQLRDDIAAGRHSIQWISLPRWTPLHDIADHGVGEVGDPSRYQKDYTPNYRFPSSSTVAFERDETANGMAIKLLPPLPGDQVEVDNDRARWPCFFPSSVGMITTWDGEGRPNIMPCGSTTLVSRHPLVVSPCVSYAAINERYAPRETLRAIRSRGWFGCGVPFISDAVVKAIKFAGTTSIRHDPDKAAHSGLHVISEEKAPLIDELPVHFECRVIGERSLGTHVMFFGEVKRIVTREDLSPENPIEWCPWARV